VRAADGRYRVISALHVVSCAQVASTSCARRHTLADTGSAGAAAEPAPPMWIAGVAGAARPVALAAVGADADAAIVTWAAAEGGSDTGVAAVSAR
jgi:hypothetical protein